MNNLKVKAPEGRRFIVKLRQSPPKMACATAPVVRWKTPQEVKHSLAGSGFIFYGIRQARP